MQLQHVRFGRSQERCERRVHDFGAGSPEQLRGAQVGLEDPGARAERHVADGCQLVELVVAVPAALELLVLQLELELMGLELVEELVDVLRARPLARPSGAMHP